MSINRVVWSPDGLLFGMVWIFWLVELLISSEVTLLMRVTDYSFLALFTTVGVAYSKHLVQIYSYHVEDLRNHLEVAPQSCIYLFLVYMLNLGIWSLFFMYFYLTADRGSYRQCQWYSVFVSKQAVVICHLRRGQDNKGILSLALHF